MDTDENYLENILKRYFQKHIKIIIDNEEYKSGKFLLYRFLTYANNYHLEFHIQRSKKIDIIKIPYPFAVEEHAEDNLIYFDYRIKTFSKNNKKIEQKIKNFASTEEGLLINKFYDRIVEFEFS